MIDRRNEGIVNVHGLLLTVETVGLWVLMATLSGKVTFYTYYSLLAAWTYWVAIALGVLLAMRFLAKIEGSLVTLGWVGAMSLAFRQLCGVACGIFTLAVASKDVGLSRIFVAIFLAMAGALCVLANRYQPVWLARTLIARAAKVPMLLMGRPENFPGLTAWLLSQRILGFEPVGVIEYHGIRTSIDGLPVVGTFEGLDEAIRATQARQVLMLELPRTAEEAEHLARVCAMRGCRLMIHNNLVVQLNRPLRALVHHGYSFLVLHDEPLENPINRFLKRTLDLVVAVPVVLLVLPPLALIVGLVQAWQSPGKLFYSQVRSGRGSLPFRIWKFRTMHEMSGGESQQARRDDDRIYPFGRFLRRTSLDEMPQFVNVLIGDMSVVGPRPHLGEHEAVFAKSAEVYRMRFFVKPGITGLAQSRGYRGEAGDSAEVQERIRLDLIYIRSWSVWLDVAIIVRTFGAVINPPRSAY